MKLNRALLISIFIFLLFPIWMMFTGSLMDIHGIMKMPPALWPKNSSLNNYFAMNVWPLLIWLKNTIIVLICTVVISVLISSSTGYVFAFYRFRFKNLLWSMLLIGIMIPRISLIIPTFVIIRKLGINRSFLAVVLPIVFSPVGIYLARVYFESIPKSLLESARLDGAKERTILLRIVMPISKPIVTALALFSAIAALQDFIWQMLVLQSEKSKTLLVGMIAGVMQRGGGDLNINPIGRTFAVAIVLLLPLVAIFLIANKYFVESISGAIKE